jgi:hypothetical protein
MAYMVRRARAGIGRVAWLLTRGTHGAEGGMKHSRLIGTVLAVGLALGGVTLASGCREKGPAERAGEKVDHAMDKVEDTLDPPHGPAERAGRKIDRAIDDAKN